MGSRLLREPHSHPQTRGRPMEVLETMTFKSFSCEIRLGRKR